MSVPVIIECGSCRKRLQLDEKFLGKKVRCPVCTMGIAVPTREEYINSGMAAKAMMMSGKRLSLNGLAKAMVELSDDDAAVAGMLSDLPEVQTWQDEVREFLGRWQAWVPSVAFHGVIVLVLALYVATSGETTSAITLRPPPEQQPVKTKDPGTQMLEEVKEPPGNETPQLFDLAMPGPKSDEPADDARLEDVVKDSPINVIATRGKSNRSIRAKSGMPSGMGPGKGKVGFFGQGGSASGVVFIIDNSYSMDNKDGRLKFCQDELKKTLNKMPNWMRFNVIWFQNRKYEAYTGALVYATAKQKAEAGAWVDAMKPENSTNPYDALKCALGFESIDLIFLLSDGAFYLLSNEEKEIIGLCKAKNVRINSIAFKDAGGKLALQALSVPTGGKYKFVP